MQIGHFALANSLFVAPMAGVTDRPFRQLCKRLGAGYAVSEMVTSRRDLWSSLKTSRRANHDGEPGPIAVQIAGTDAQMMADAAVYNIERGAQIIDINMGCPAKKVCNKWAGSALMQDEALAVSIADAVVQACAPRGVPVTLKMRTGWCQAHRNAVALARAFELVEHLHDHYSLYDEFIGVRSARKHIAWYVRALPGGEAFRAYMNALETSDEQVAAVERYLDKLNEKMDRIPAWEATSTVRGHNTMTTMDYAL